MTAVVVKRYPNLDHDQAHREWRALNLLDGTNLAPVPLRADLNATPPTIVMSRLDGTSLEAFTPDTVDAVARTLRQLQAVPSDGLPDRAGAPGEMLRQVREWCAAIPAGRDDLFDTARAWIDHPGLDETIARASTPVFGTGDGNVANFLWDGDTIRVIDFEYAGRSDLAYELAEIVEHVSAGGTGPLLLDRFDLDAREAARLHECRRLFAFYWLLRVQERPDVAALQAARLGSLL